MEDDIDTYIHVAFEDTIRRSSWDPVDFHASQPQLRLAGDEWSLNALLDLDLELGLIWKARRIVKPQHFIQKAYSNALI
jgi:hypothetical protein